MSGNQLLINAALNGLRYVPAANYNGTDKLTVTTTDGSLTDTDTVDITVNPVNDTPVTVADSIVVAEGGTATLLVGGATSLLTNDTDVDGDALTAILVSGPANGTLTLNPERHIQLRPQRQRNHHRQFHLSRQRRYGQRQHRDRQYRCHAGQ